MKNYGNAYHVANSNWYSIHHPISEDIICGRSSIDEVDYSPETYYANTSQVASYRMKNKRNNIRNFHNFVKFELLKMYSKPGNTLLDVAVGKGGDAQKWKHLKLDFVLGIDSHNNNLVHKIDGACARYLDLKKKRGGENLYKAMFLHGNSKLNFKSGEAFYDSKHKAIFNSVVGKGSQDENAIGKGVKRIYGKGETGFDVCSCMFALHYFFENKETLHGFIANIVQNTKLGSKFVGCCYDGRTVMNLMKRNNVDHGETYSIIDRENNNRLVDIKRMYSDDEFVNDDSSLGYEIKVKQASINKEFSEYLVNFEYFIEVMRNYGFELESEKFFDGGFARFSKLYHNITMARTAPNTRLDQERQNAANMAEGEKELSFLNVAFAFKKVNNVNLEQVRKLYIDDSEINESLKIIRRIKNTQRKIILKD